MKSKQVLLVMSLLITTSAFAAADPHRFDPSPAVEAHVIGEPQTLAGPALGWSAKFVPLFTQTQRNGDSLWVMQETQVVLPATFVNRDPVTGWSTCDTKTVTAKYVKTERSQFPAGDAYFDEVKATLYAAAMTGSTVRVLLQDVCHGGYITFIGLIVDRPE